ncbi:MAG: aminoacetone oxidase family FAD-binding enzyme [Coriobacteriia bacterium]|nr:aminoacetone oxidase family FAD-binding enzyme [Coriobacteriia bacterium]
MQKPRVLVIGGGAAGLSAAIAAARQGASATLLEAGPRAGRKILASGNGRCNLSNSSAGPLAYNHPEFVEPVLAAYPAQRIREFFSQMGLLTFADAEGRVYPVTNAAASVLEVLRLECARLGVVERCGFEVASISQPSDAVGFEVVASDGERLGADAVVVATGGGDSLLAVLGHQSVDCEPVLGPLKTAVEPIRGLSGVRVRCEASLRAKDGRVLATERGELLFREYGVSGIMVFDLSRFFEPGSVLSIDLFPDLQLRELEAMLVRRSEDLSWRAAETFFDGMLQSRMAEAVLRAALIEPPTPVAELSCEQLAGLLKRFELSVTGRGDAKQAQVTRGGLSVDEIDPHTMASRRVDGLFAAGEVLDIDGRCGGFNLHWAWASGILAGLNAAYFAEQRATARDTLSGGSE